MELTFTNASGAMRHKETTMANKTPAPMFRPEALALAANVLAQAKGELSGARHLTGEAHGWLCSIDPTWRAPAPVDAPADADLLADLETAQLDAATATAQIVKLGAALTERTAERDEALKLAEARFDIMESSGHEFTKLHAKFKAAQAERDTAIRERQAMERTIESLQADVVRLSRKADNAASDVLTMADHAVDAVQRIAPAPAPVVKPAPAPAAPWSAGPSTFVGAVTPSQGPAKAAPAPVAASGVDPFGHLPPAMATWARNKAAAALDID